MLKIGVVWLHQMSIDHPTALFVCLDEFFRVSKNLRRRLVVVLNLTLCIGKSTLNNLDDNLIEGRFNLIRRSNDVSQSNNFVPSPQVGSHKDPDYGTHHARDAALLFKTLGYDLNFFSSAMIVNTQYMHILHFHLKKLAC